MRLKMIVATMMVACSGVAFSQNVENMSLIERVTKLEKKNDNFSILLHTQGSLYSNFNNYDGNDLTAFRMGQLRLGLSGRINDKLTFDFRQKLNASNSAGFLDNLPHSIDLAQITYYPSAKWAINMGRQCVDYGGFEFDLNPVNVYQYSSYLMNLSGFLTGISIHHKFSPTQELRFQIVDNRIGTFEEVFGNNTGLESSKAPFTYSALWIGSMANGKFQTRWSSTVTHETSNKNNIALFIGNKYNFRKGDMYFDVMYSREDLDRTGIISSVMNCSDQSKRALNTEYLTLVSRINYRVLPKWNLFVKGSYETAGIFKNAEFMNDDNEMTSVDKDVLKRTISYNGGVEFYPLADNNFRFFATYMGRIENYSDVAKSFGASNQTPQRFETGFVYVLPIY